MHKHLPSIERLQVSTIHVILTMSYSFSEIHLPGQHMVVFDPDEPVHTIALRATSEQTTLTQYFNINCLENDVGMQARNLTYQNFPHEFCLEQGHKDIDETTKRLFSGPHVFHSSNVRQEVLFENVTDNLSQC